MYTREEMRQEQARLDRLMRALLDVAEHSIDPWFGSRCRKWHGLTRAQRRCNEWQPTREEPEREASRA